MKWEFLRNLKQKQCKIYLSLQSHLSSQILNNSKLKSIKNRLLVFEFSLTLMVFVSNIYQKFRKLFLQLFPQIILTNLEVVFVYTALLHVNWGSHAWKT